MIVLLVTFVLIKVLFPESAPIGNQAHTISNQKIVIIPMSGIPTSFLLALRKTLESQHDTGVLVATALGKGDEMLIPGSDQYNTDYLALVGKEIGQSLDRPNAFFIVLTNEDINSPDSGLRFVFSAHYDGVSVVSLARINELNFGLVPKLIEIPGTFLKMQERALKLINKAIGYGVYHLDASSDINDVMYGPIMGIHDLDRVGTWYQKGLTNQSMSPASGPLHASPVQHHY
ncbi:MAG: hypothetical protein R3E57_00585 [Porticoccaceae bacterium]